MELVFELGERSAPKGHALLYFRSLRDRDEVWATYLVVPPIAMDLAKYMPPMFASQLPLQLSSSLAAYPLPPLPEQVPSQRWVEELAQVRQDDLLVGGQVDPTDLQRMLSAVSEAAQTYAALYADWSARAPASKPEPLSDVDVDDLLYSVMSDREKVSKLAKLVGTLSYAVEGADARETAAATREMEKIGRHLETKYRVDALIKAAGQPGEAGRALAQLYVERAYKIAAEEYGALGAIEEQIRRFERTTD